MHVAYTLPIYFGLGVLCSPHLPLSGSRQRYEAYPLTSHQNDTVKLISHLMDSQSLASHPYYQNRLFFYEAVESNQLDLLKMLINYPVPTLAHKINGKIDYPRRRKVTLLHMAAERGHGKIVQWLLACGASFCEDGDGNTPFSDAWMNDHADIIVWMSQSSNSLPQPKDLMGLDPILSSFWQKHPSLVRLFFRYNTQIKNRQKEAMNPLHHACEAGLVKIAQLLIHHYQLNPLLQDNKGANAFHHACRSGHITLIHGFVKKHKEGIDLLDGGGWAPLHWAINLQNVEAANYLIHHGANVDQEDSYGWTPLHWACLTKQRRMICLLLCAHANLDKPCKAGKTVLHYACQYGDIAIVKWLLQCRANAYVKDHAGYTPMEYAKGLGNAKIISLLQTYGPKVVLPNTRVYTITYLGPIGHPQTFVPQLVPIYWSLAQIAYRTPQEVNKLVREVYQRQMERLLVRGYTRQVSHDFTYIKEITFLILAFFHIRGFMSFQTFKPPIPHLKNG